MKRTLASAVLLLLLAVNASGQLVFSGLTMFSSAANGAQSGAYWWESIPGNVSNVYVFTGSIGSPTFLNSGDTSGSLNANLSLSVGTYQIFFAGNQVPNTGYIGLNFYFDGDFTDAHNRISATVPQDGSSNFSTITGTTYGNASLVPGANGLSYTSGGLTATLTDLHTVSTTNDLVDATALGAAGGPDLIGQFTLTVTAIPEPATGALWCGFAALGLARWRRRRLGSSAAL